MRAILILALLTGLFAGCTTNQTAPVPSSTTQSQIQLFITAAEDKRGTPLGAEAQAEVEALVLDTRRRLNDTQSDFLKRVAKTIAMNAATVSAIYPEAGRPLSEAEAVKRIETRLGKRLGEADQVEVKTTTQARGEAVSALKAGLASRLSDRMGLNATVITTLMPLLGF